MSMWDRPVDPGGLRLPGGALERRDWAHVPRPPPIVARLLRITWRVSRWGAGVYLGFWLAALISAVAGVRLGSLVFYALFGTLAVSVIGTVAHSLVGGVVDARMLRVIADRGVFATGSRRWPLAEIVGVVLDLDEGATRHTGVRDVASCRVALVLREHLVVAEKTRDDRRGAATTRERATPDELLAAADRAFAAATILRSAVPEETSDVASALASQLGVPLVEV